MPTLQKTRTVELRFNAAAPTYEDQSQVHDVLAQKLLTDTPAQRPQRILDIGAGTGILTRRIHQHFPTAQITALDISSAMLEHHQRLSSEQAFQYIHADFSKQVAKQPYDLICSSAALHWIQPLPELMAQLDRHLAPGGHLSVAVMCAGTFGQLREAQAHALGKEQVPPFLPQAKDWQRALQNTPWDVSQFHVDRVHEVHASARDFLNSLHHLGVTGHIPTEEPMTRGALERTCVYYDAHFACEEGVFAEYEVLYFHAQK